MHRAVGHRPLGAYMNFQDSKVSILQHISTMLGWLTLSFPLSFLVLLVCYLFSNLFLCIVHWATLEVMVLIVRLGRAQLEW